MSITRRNLLLSSLSAAAVGQLSYADAASGVMKSAAGTGKQGYGGDGGPAAQALLDQPFHCSQDRKGNFYIADTFNHCIRKADRKTGKISTVAGCGKKGYYGDHGQATLAALNEPYGVLPDEEGNLFIVDRLNYVIRRVDADTGIITTYAGSHQPGYFGDGGPADRAMMREPNALDFDPKGNLYIADVSDNRIRRVDANTRVITTVAGSGRREFSGDGGPAAQASMNGARGVAFDRAGNMYVCEREGNRVRFANAKTGLIRTVAGTGAKGYSGDGGPALEATFNGPKWIHVGPDSGVYIVDTENHCVRRYDPGAKTVTTVAGGRIGSGGDDGPALEAGMDRPHGCWVDRAGTLYTADTNNHRIRACSLNLPRTKD
jgi:streptogramin lyase